MSRRHDDASFFARDVRAGTARARAGDGRQDEKFSFSSVRAEQRERSSRIGCDGFAAHSSRRCGVRAEVGGVESETDFCAVMVVRSED